MSNSEQSSSETISEESRQMLDSLRRAVHKALERKRRLGQYAVVWKDGKPVAIGGDAPAISPQEQKK